MVAVLVANVCLRLTASRSIIWLEEIAYLCFAWVVFVGAAAAYKRNLHSGIDMLVKALPVQIKKPVAIFGMLLTLAACLIMVGLSFNFAVQAWEKYTPYLYIRYTFIDIAVTAGFVFMSAHCLAFIGNMIRHGDYAKEMPLYRAMESLDAVMSGTVDTNFHSASMRERGKMEGE
jgi:TRAP-type C4-dicarboxylate transport system permease small subunit